jgi:hypothetical protein
MDVELIQFALRDADGDVDQALDGDPFRLQRSGARKGEQVGEDLLHVTDLLERDLAQLHRFGVLFGTGGPAENLQRHLDGGERVAQIVGDHAGHSSHRRQRLGADQLPVVTLDLGLQPLPLGDILLHRQEVGDFAVGVADRGDRGRLPVEFAALLAIVELAAPFAAAGDGAPEVAVLLLGGFAGLQNARILPQHLLRLVTGHLGKLGVDVLDQSLATGNDHDAGTLFDGAGELAQLLLVAALVGDVLADAGDTDHLALGVVRERVIPGDQPQAAAARLHVILEMGGKALRIAHLTDHPLHLQMHVAGHEAPQPADADHLVAVPSRHAEKIVVTEGDLAGAIERDGGEVDVLQGVAEALLVIPLRLRQMVAEARVGEKPGADGQQRQHRQVEAEMTLDEEGQRGGQLSR